VNVYQLRERGGQVSTEHKAGIFIQLQQPLFDDGGAMTAAAGQCGTAAAGKVRKT
jgi:hypothetical protein